MYLNLSTLAIVLSISWRTSAKPIDGKLHAVKREDPVSYPYGDALTNEFQWLGWDSEDEDQKKDGQAIHEAFKQWADLAKAGVTAAQGAPDNVHFKRFFGTQDADDTKAIQNTMANMYDNTAGTATETIKKMVLERKDFGDHCVKDGWFAYTDAATGHFHMCPKAIALKQNSETECGDFKRDYIDNTARTLSFVMLHEFTHYDFVADDRIGAIIDNAITSVNCFNLDDEDKLENAQSYAFNAAEQYWSDKCPNKDFTDPGVTRPAEPTEAVPATTSEAPLPTEAVPATTSEAPLPTAPPS